jgi:hypothetical protein
MDPFSRMKQFHLGTIAKPLNAKFTNQEQARKIHVLSLMDRLNNEGMRTRMACHHTWNTGLNTDSDWEQTCEQIACISANGHKD